MKRFLFWFVVVLVAIVLVRSHRPQPMRHGSRPPVIHRRLGPDWSIGSQRILDTSRDGQRIVTIDERGVVIVHETTSRRDADPPHEARFPERVYVDDLPVAIVPGSRVTEADTSTPKPPDPPKPVVLPPPPASPRQHLQEFDRLAESLRALPPPPVPPWQHRAHSVVVPPTPTYAPPVSGKMLKGRLSATEQRAHDDTRAQLVKMVTEWLAPDVPKTWKVPDELIDTLVVEIRVSPVVQPTDPVSKDYGPMYEADMRVDLSPLRRAEIVDAYHHEQTLKRLGVLGALFAFVLVCLAAVSGYIRADEATKGYYTNRLRLAATVAAGAAGVAVYRWLA